MWPHVEVRTGSQDGRPHGPHTFSQVLLTERQACRFWERHRATQLFFPVLFTCTEVMGQFSNPSHDLPTTFQLEQEWHWKERGTCILRPSVGHPFTAALAPEPFPQSKSL